MKMYYLLLDPTLKPPVKTYWCGDNKKADVLTELRGYVIPLGKNKPKNILIKLPWEYFREKYIIFNGV